MLKGLDADMMPTQPIRFDLSGKVDIIKKHIFFFFR